MSNVKFGEAFLKRRAELGMTQNAVAELAGVNQSTLCKIESGQSSGTAITYLKLCDVLRLEPGTLARADYSKRKCTRRD